jgi:hypothetical protein
LIGKSILETDASLLEELQNLKTLKTLTSNESKTDFYNIPSCFDKYQVVNKEHQKSPIKIESKSPKKSIALKIPGPAYYNPVLPAVKISFNSLENKKTWI